ncbi:MAG: aminotransferase class V-fold PLP-dependent enzyme [Saprospiraceae bacterium]|nr:aminotransferase class V-fold PLP-dependent enzyme [Saprospiraceae bacterium]
MSTDLTFSFYTGAQKNMGPAGTTLVIVRKSALGKVNRDYQPALI